MLFAADCGKHFQWPFDIAKRNAQADETLECNFLQPDREIFALVHLPAKPPRPG